MLYYRDSTLSSGTAGGVANLTTCMMYGHAYFPNLLSKVCPQALSTDRPIDRSCNRPLYLSVVISAIDLQF